MAKKMIRPIHSEADYDAALKEIERYFENEPEPGTPEARLYSDFLVPREWV